MPPRRRRRPERRSAKTTETGGRAGPAPRRGDRVPPGQARGRCRGPAGGARPRPGNRRSPAQHSPHSDQPLRGPQKTRPTSDRSRAWPRESGVPGSGWGRLAGAWGISHPEGAQPRPFPCGRGARSVVGRSPARTAGLGGSVSENARHDDLKSTGRATALAKGRELGHGSRRRTTSLCRLRNARLRVPVSFPPSRVLHVRALHRTRLVRRLQDLLRQHGVRPAEASPRRPPRLSSS